MPTKLRSHKAITKAIPYWEKGRAVLLALMTFLGACALLPEEPRETIRLPTDAEVEQYNAQVPPEERIVCREETAVGTNIPQRKCRYLRDVEEASRFTREQLRNILH